MPLPCEAMSYRYLWTPLQVGPVATRNRIVFSAHLTNYARDGKPTEQHAAYYAARAEGGAGLIITEEHSTHPTDWPYEKLIHGFHRDVIPGYRRITDAVHRHRVPIFAQINHNGGQASSMFSRLPVWAPSAVADPLFREVPKAVTQAEIDEIVSGYALVAEHCAEGGFDGIELQCSHSSIVRGFLSPATNRRTDDYGGALANRARLLLELVSAVRRVIGTRLALGVRICGDELIDGGTTIDEAVHVARLVEASMHVPPGYAMFIPSAIRTAVDLPVVGVGRFKDPLQAERALAEGHCDLVGVVRGQIADPALKKLISRLTKIPSVPSVYRQLVDELERSEPCLSRVAELVARDVAMITKLLHLVNSAFFGAPRRIQSPAHAVAMLGLDLLRPLVLSFGVFAQFHDERSSALSLSEIVSRSLQLSRLAARIVADLKPNDCRMMEDALLAGMIADVGLLVLASQKDLPYREMIESARGGTDRLYELERARWQVNHAGVGAYLLGLWGLPDQIVEAVAFHHEPQLCRSERPNALTAVHLADALLSETAVEQQDAALHSHFDETYVESLGLTARLPHWRRLAQQVVADPPVHAV